MFTLFRKNRPATPAAVCDRCGSPNGELCSSVFHVLHDDDGHPLPDSPKGGN